VKEIGSGWFNRRIVDVEREANLVDIEPQRSIDIPHRNMTTSTENFMAAVLVVFIALASSSV
jgi:hypothetical protein